MAYNFLNIRLEEVVLKQLVSNNLTCTFRILYKSIRLMLKPAEINVSTGYFFMNSFLKTIFKNIFETASFMPGQRTILV